MAELQIDKPFSLEAANPPGLKKKITFFMLDKVLPVFMGLLARFAPVWKIPGKDVMVITGFDAVQEVFSRENDFHVPYEKQVEVLSWPYFLLALQNTPEYWHIHENVMQLWRADDLQKVQQIARDKSVQALVDHEGEIDLIQHLVKPVLIAICEQYYGVEIANEEVQPFFDGSLAGSGFVFSGPNISAEQAAHAKSAVAGVWPVIDAAMSRAKANPNPDTVLGRYYLQGYEENFPANEMRSSVMAMIGGFFTNRYKCCWSYHGSAVENA